MKPIMIQFDSWRFVKEYVGYVSRYISYGFPRFLYCYPSGNLDWIVSQIESLLLPEYRQHFDLFYPRIEKLYSVIVSQYLSEPSKFVKQENTLISPSKRQKILKLSLQGSLRSNSFPVDFMSWNSTSPRLPLFLKDQFLSRKLPGPWFLNVFRKDQLKECVSSFFSFSENIDQFSVLFDLDDGATKCIPSTPEADQKRASIKKMIADSNPSPLCNLLPIDDEHLSSKNSISLEKCLQSSLAMVQNAENGQAEEQGKWRVYYLPPYLTLHLSRSTYHTFKDSQCKCDANSNSNSNSNYYVQYKVQTKVDYPLRDLDMNPFVFSENPRREYVYDLVGVCCHSGQTDCGHYYTFCRDKEENGEVSWWKYNDEIVMRVKESEVMTMKACMLVYEQKNKARYTIKQIRELIQKSMAKPILEHESEAS